TDVNEEMDDSLVRAATTASSLEAEQDSGGGPKRQETIGDTIAQTRVLALKTTKTTQGNKITSLKKRVKKLERRNRSRTHKLKRLYKIGLSGRVESSDEEGLGKEDASKQGRISNIDTDVGISLVSTHFDVDIDMFGVHDLVGDEVVVETEVAFKDVNLSVDGSSGLDITVKVEGEGVWSFVVWFKGFKRGVREVVNFSTDITIPVSAATTTTTTTIITNDEITLAKALSELKSAKPPTQGIAFRKPSESITTTPTLTTTNTATTITADSTRPKAKGIVIHKEDQAPTPTVSSQQPSQVKVQDKGKGKMVEPEPVKKMSKKDLLRLDEELAFKLQAKVEANYQAKRRLLTEFDEEERIAREKDEANVALIEEWNDIQAKIEAYQLFIERLQAREQEELTIEEMAKLFQQLLEKRRKHFAAKREKEKRNRPPTKAQQRSIMCTYLKNIEGWKPKDLVEGTKQEEGAKKAEADVIEGSKKRARTELEQEVVKKQKVDVEKETEQETTELQSLMKIVPDEEEVEIDAIPLATKPPSILDWKIIKKGKISYF
ncbi:hypothetical protein Tco_1011233, partial [Tanacetum coccineum]